MKLLSIAAFLGAISITSMVSSTVAAASINERQHKQSHRIEQGIESGELNKREVHRLNHQQARIDKKEAYFKSDGTFTKKERAIIRHDLNKASRNIYKQKHDAQTQH